MNSGEIKHLLSKRYSSPSFAFLTEVRSGTGYIRQVRYADALAMSLYPSTGLEITGFEIKVARSDWLNELKNPAKSDEIIKFCDRWWIVATEGVVDPVELPKTWGLIVAKNGRLYVKVKAPLLKAKTIDRVFLASLLRSTTESVVDVSTMDAATKEAWKDGKRSAEEQIQKAEAKLQKYKDQVHKFEEASGIKVLDDWRDGEELGIAIKFILSGGVRDVKWNVESALEYAKKSIEALSKLERFAKSIQEIKINQTT